VVRRGHARKGRASSIYGRTATSRLFSPSSIARLRDGCTPMPPRKGWGRASPTSRPWGSDVDEAGLVAARPMPPGGCSPRGRPRELRAGAVKLHELLVVAVGGLWPVRGDAGQGAQDSIVSSS
jgi:hypothetical protein